MSIVILGVTGMLGHAVQAFFQHRGDHIHGFSSSTLDITNSDDLTQLHTLDPRPTHIINCAAYTRVDDAETQRDLAVSINGTALEPLAKIANALDAVMVHFSTDYVFDGCSSTPYSESDPIHPLNVYGTSKSIGELLILTHTKKAYVFRVQWLFGSHGSHFVDTMLRLMSDKPELQVVSDQWGSLTATDALVGYVAACLDKRAPYGCYHCTSSGYASWYDVAVAIGNEMGYTGTILPVDSTQFPRPAQRPLNGRLDCRKYDSLVGFEREPWQTGLRRYIQSLEGETS